jgi:nitroreductase
MDLR